MAIEGFDYNAFVEELSAEARALIPAEFQDFQKQYIINSVNKFSTRCAESMYKDEKLNFTLDQARLITQVIAEWSFHKSIDLIKAGILPDYWDGIMEKIIFTIFTISKQSMSSGLPDNKTLQVVEHHVNKAYKSVLTDLNARGIIDKVVCNRALSQSNIDDMMKIREKEEE